MSQEFESFRRYIEKWTPRLGLQAHEITVVHEKLPHKSKADARTYSNSVTVRAQIIFNKKPPDEDRDLERIAVHELMHVALTNFAHRAADNIEALCKNKVAVGQACDELSELEERVCDSMAVNLVRWEKKK